MLLSHVRHPLYFVFVLRNVHDGNARNLQPEQDPGASQTSRSLPPSSMGRTRVLCSRAQRWHACTAVFTSSAFCACCS